MKRSASVLAVVACALLTSCFVLLSLSLCGHAIVALVFERRHSGSVYSRTLLRKTNQNVPFIRKKVIV